MLRNCIYKVDQAKYECCIYFYQHESGDKLIVNLKNEKGFTYSLKNMYSIYNFKETENSIFIRYRNQGHDNKSFKLIFFNNGAPDTNIAQEIFCHMNERLKL